MTPFFQLQRPACERLPTCWIRLQPIHDRYRPPLVSRNYSLSQVGAYTHANSSCRERKVKRREENTGTSQPSQPATRGRSKSKEIARQECKAVLKQRHWSCRFPSQHIMTIRPTYRRLIVDFAVRGDLRRMKLLAFGNFI